MLDPIVDESLCGEKVRTPLKADRTAPDEESSRQLQSDRSNKFGSDIQERQLSGGSVRQSQPAIERDQARPVLCFLKPLETLIT
jgi:hypothetical protein